MKRTLLILLTLLLSLPAFSQKRDSVLVQNEIYRIVYSEVLEQPRNIKYTVRCLNGDVPRSGMDFVKESGVHTSDDEDYANNHWDKGHCAPAANFNCTKDMLLKTFSYVNCVLQNDKLNRGPWKSLEAHERELAKKSTIVVEIRVEFSKRSLKLPTGATVPDGFSKMIYSNGKLVECYYFNNEIPKEPNYRFYRMKCKRK